MKGALFNADGPCFVIAEAGVNHDGDVDTALRLVDAAAAAGADAVKFQTFRSAKVISPRAPQAAYQARNTGRQESQLDMVRRLELSAEAHHRISQHCAAAGICFLSTPFDEESLDLLLQLKVPALKVASGEITNHPFLQRLAQTRLPLIISTGMSTLDEVEKAVRLVREAGARDLCLLQCVSMYPADPADVNLRAMLTMRERFQVPVGYSDHTLGCEVPWAAVALGAAVIEKHFTLDKGRPGPDHRASADPLELKDLVRGIRKIESALGTGEKRPAAAEKDTADVARRSLVAEVDLPAGTVLLPQMIGSRRPGTGLPPYRLPELVGRRIRVAMVAGELFTLDNLS